MVATKENSCRTCRKVFCCSDCRDAHEIKRHPVPSCALCVKQPLPFKLSKDLDISAESKIVNHLVVKHLPVYCKLCGENYTNCQELETAGPCTWWEVQRKRDEKRAAEPIKIPCISEIKNDPATEIEKKLPHTPLLTNNNNDPEFKSLHGSSMRTKHSKQDNFDSPPETLVRHTSTPMHTGPLSVAGQKPKGNISAISQFFFKTPASSLDHLKRTFNSTGSADSRSAFSGSSNLESRYYTGIEITPVLKLNPDCTKIGHYQSVIDSPLQSILKKTLDPMSSTDINDYDSPNIRKLDPRFLKPEALERVKMNTTRDSMSEKRVRFSNQHLGPTSSTAASAAADISAHSVDNDIFFEARETLDESLNATSIVDADRTEEAEQAIERAVEETDKDEDHDKKDDVAKSCECCSKDGQVVEQKESLPSPVQGKSVEIEKSCAVESNAVSPITGSTTSTTSSRVVMMLLVEKTVDAKGFSSLDLAPLIDSGLKKLEESAASVSNSSNINKSHECSGASLKSSTGICSFTRKVDGSLTERSITKSHSPAIAGSSHAIKASIKDSYVSISDRVECFTPPARRRNAGKVTEEQEQELSNKADNMTANANKPDGLFSMVAKVVRSAFQKLPGGGTSASRNVSREPMSQIPCSPINVSSTSSSSYVSSSEVMLQRSATKRPRERADSIEDQNQPPPRESPGNPSSNSSPARNDLVVHSPVAKRHRGWYRIKAREPIARMRQITSPRGTSSETQRFQLGELTVGDTLIPLPSRAHQYTQTED